MQSRALALLTLESKRPLIVVVAEYKLHIKVGDSKNAIVFDPLLTRHVIWRMRSGSVHIFNGNEIGNVITCNSRTDRRRVFKLGGRVGHVTRHV